jgi:hypothetical protein
MCTKSFRDLHLILLFKCSKKKIWIFFDPVQWTHLTMVPKSDPKGTFELCPTKKIFSPKINQDRVSSNDCDLLNDFHVDWLSFSVYGEKNKIGPF